MINSTIDPAILTVFIPTFFFVSITPGMCMTLAMTLGMTIGLRRTLWMMWGELLGVALVSLASVLGVAAILLNYPAFFLLLKTIGGAYLCHLGIQMWRSKGKMAICEQVEEKNSSNSLDLAAQGLVTAVANPKAWAFMISLLPPFIDPGHALGPQLTILLSLILIIEFCCLVIYASGGKTLRRFLRNRSNVQVMNRIAGTLMLGVACWLILG